MVARQCDNGIFKVGGIDKKQRTVKTQHTHLGVGCVELEISGVTQGAVGMHAHHHRTWPHHAIEQERHRQCDAAQDAGLDARRKGDCGDKSDYRGDTIITARTPGFDDAAEINQIGQRRDDDRRQHWFG